MQEQSTIDNMIERILTHMLSLIRCERAMLLLVHEKSNKTFSRVFDLDSSELEEMDAIAATCGNRQREGTSQQVCLLFIRVQQNTGQEHSCVMKEMKLLINAIGNAAMMMNVE